MDQTAEEALRQELSHLRQKLQNQTGLVPEDYAEKIKAFEDENHRLNTLLEGKCMNFVTGDVLFVENHDLITMNPDAWTKLAIKIGISIVSLPNNGIQYLSKATDEQLKEAGLQKIQPMMPYSHLDQLMHYLQAQLDAARNLNRPDFVGLLKDTMGQVYEAMEKVKALNEKMNENKEPDHAG